MRKILSLLCLSIAVIAMAGRASAPEAPKAVPVAKPQQAAPQKPLPWSTPKDAVDVAFIDGAEIQPEDLPFTKWIWNADPAAYEDFQALSHAFGLITNAASLELAPGIVARPRVRGILARIDLRWYASNAEDLARLLAIWEDFAFDPAFSLLFTRDALAKLEGGTLVQVRRNVRADGKETGKREWVTAAANTIKNAAVARVNPPKLVAAGIEQLQAATKSQAPIVSLDYFVSRALSTIKRSPAANEADKKKDSVFDTIWGGRYYELANTPRSKEKGVSDLDALLGWLRIGDGKRNFATVLDELRGTGRAVAIRSGVTGKRRLTVLVYAPAGNPSVAAPLLAITFDIRDEDVDLKSDALITFIASIIQAHEVIWIDATGMQRYALYDANGNLVDEVPIDVATDSTIPHPYPQRLDIFGCVRCHGPNAGYQPLVNDLRDVFRYNPKQLLSQVDRDKITGWHAGDITKPLSRARDDYSLAVLTMTGRWKGDAGQTDTVRLSSAQLALIFARNRYDMVGPGEALRRLGQPEPAEGQELATLRRLLPEIEVQPKVFILDDMRIEALRAGKKITPYDFAFIYSLLLERVFHRN